MDKYRVTNIDCATCAAKIEHGLKNVPGLHEAVASLCNPEDPAEASSAIEFILEGLHLSNKLNREVHQGTRLYKENTESSNPSLKETIKL